MNAQLEFGGNWTTGVNFINIIHERFSYKNFGAKPNVTREKLPKRRLYKKPARITLMKLTPDGNLMLTNTYSDLRQTGSWPPSPSDIVNTTGLY